MIILGIDSSGRQSSVCIMRDEKPIFTCVQDTGVTHSQNLLPMVENALNICGLKPQDISLFAVTHGPGSFTGIRISLAMVKGMATAKNTPCIGVSSLLSMAAATDLKGIVIPTFDARRNQIYACVVDEGEIICPDFCQDVHFLEKYIQNAKKTVFFVGDGRSLCYNIYGNFEFVSKTAPDMPCVAYGACLLAAEEYAKNGVGSHFDLTPT
ncbi:MAG: tRNA (adenosine(37)-N6)-threonylcarbamoyltransferase complex dimerization subunit type 1 TsaB [Oscillospiraceae bacterium]